MYSAVARHEGATHAAGSSFATTSHWGIGDSVFVHRQLQAIFDELTATNRAAYVSWLDGLFYSYGPYVRPQAVFDASGDPQMWNICNFKP